MSQGQRTNRGEERKLSLLDTCGMAIGGMVGGGIFSVLGEAVRESGNAAFLSFALAGLLALMTAVSYTRLTLSFDEPGGSFTFVEEIAGPHLAGTLSWFLILGYTFAIGLYAYTFGAYAGILTGLGSGWSGFLAFGIVGLLTAVNLMGVRESGATENILVYTKVAILLFVAVVALFTVSPTKALPVFEYAPSTILTGAALIFVAYEGFELLAADYDDIAAHRKNLPRAMHISIPAVMFLYVLIAFVTTGSVDVATVEAHKETVLAYTARPVLGQIGFTLVLVSAVFSTASAINATLFATSRLALRVAQFHQIPAKLTDWQRARVPVPFLLMIAAAAAAIAVLANLN